MSHQRMSELNLSDNRATGHSADVLPGPDTAALGRNAR